MGISQSRQVPQRFQKKVVGKPEVEEPEGMASGQFGAT
jgi:hypothetical protein